MSCNWRKKEGKTGQTLYGLQWFAADKDKESESLNESHTDERSSRWFDSKRHVGL